MDGILGKKLKVEMKLGGAEGGARGSSTDVSSEFTRVTRDARTRLRDAVAKIANDAGCSAALAVCTTPHLTGNGPPNVAREHASTPLLKTPKYFGRSNWEAFLAQFELLAQSEGWSMDTRALQLALCLTDDAFSCLLLLSPKETGGVWGFSQSSTGTFWAMSTARAPV